MTGNATITTGWRAWAGLTLVGLLFLVPAVGALAKQAMSPLYLLVMAIVLIASYADRKRWPTPQRPIWLFFAALVIYVAATQAFVSPCGQCTLKGPEKLAMLGATLWFLAPGALQPASWLPRDRIYRGLFAGVIVGAVLVSVELIFDAPLYRAFNGLAVDAKVEASRYNRGISALVILAWPLTAYLVSRAQGGTAFLVIGASLVAAALGESAAALLSAIVAIAIYPIARLNPRAVLFAGAGLLSIGIAAAPWIGSRALDWGRALSGQVADSYFHRLEILDHAASRALERFWTGWGLGGYRYTPTTTEDLARYRIFDHPTTHPHNAAIQAWVELGLFGAVLAIGLVWLTTFAIARMPVKIQPAAIAGFAAVTVTALLAYGLWQTTWMAIMGLTAALFVFLARGLESE
jgi:exopolysaccharide production protein ExoQ